MNEARIFKDSTQTWVDPDESKTDEAAFDAGSSSTPTADRSWGASLASPRGVMILVPLLVLALGLVLTLIGQVALGAVSRTMAKESFLLQTSSVSRSLEDTLGQAEPLIDELTRIARDPQLAAAPEQVEEEVLKRVVLEVRELLIGRSGITQVYIAYDDGRFLSADRNDENGVEVQITTAGKSSSFQITGQNVERLAAEDSGYDPRTRPWYQSAKEEGQRIWSAPYSFYHRQHTGVTRARPIYKIGLEKRLLAVVGVDFDVNALTTFMASADAESADVSSVVFTSQGVVLAYPRAKAKLAALPRSEEVVTHEMLKDASLSTLVSRVQQLGQANEPLGLISYMHGREAMVASVQSVGADVPGWYVATFASERSVLHELYAHRKSSLWVGLVALLIALLVAWLLARHLLKVRAVASAAQAAAKKAQEKVRELGSYRLISLIGEGGMGQVWRARHLLLARQAAVKLIKKEEGSEKRRTERRHRFRREAQAIAGLRSRNTVDLYDYGVTSDGTLFYVMELLDGIDLHHLVSDHGPQPAERVRKILMQVCNSLSEAHAAQLVHRDIKPANLFLCRAASEVDVVKVLDFGLVFQPESDESITESSEDNHLLEGRIDGAEDKGSMSEDEIRMLALQSSSNSSSSSDFKQTSHGYYLVGTPAFMSPEQALGTETDGRSDLYSLACVAWWLLSGETVFSAATPMGLMLKHIDERAPDIRQSLPPTVPDALLAVIASCLEKSPLDRPQSAAELGQELIAMGPLEPGWTENDAQRWWREKMPPRPEPSLNLSEPPLRGAELLIPEARQVEALKA